MAGRRLGFFGSIDQSLHLAVNMVNKLPLANPLRYGVELQRDVPYLKSGSPAHTLDVYRPISREIGAARRPAVMYVHGGGFTLLSKETHRVMALNFAARGYVVFNINYRLSTSYVYPAPLEDAAAALVWVADNAARYGADPSRLVLAGESAGANLVTALTVAATERREEAFAQKVYDRAPPLSAVLPIYGLLDLHDLHRFTTHPRLAAWIKRLIVEAGASYVGRPVREQALSAPLASPLRLLAKAPSPEARRLPPFFVAAGSADPLLDDSRRLQAAVEARGGICRLAIFPGEIHGFNALIWRKAAQDKWRAVGEFLRLHVG